MDVEEEVSNSRVGALLLAKKIERFGNEESIYMWDEVILYLKGRQREANK